jgi:hypothetical protein
MIASKAPTRQLSTSENVAIEMANELLGQLVNRSIEYMDLNSELDLADAGAVDAYRRKIQNTISLKAIAKLMYEAVTQSNGSVVFELSRGKGSNSWRPSSRTISNSAPTSKIAPSSSRPSLKRWACNDQRAT